MLDFDPDFNVWTRSKADENGWSLLLNTSDLKEALALAKRIGRGDTIAMIYEQGVFTHDGRRVVDQVGFWWSRNAYKAMGSHPRGRGYGYSDTHGEFVEYEYPMGGEAETTAHRQLAISAGGEVAEAEEATQYAEVECERCHKLFPGNLAQNYAHEVETGRVSGTTRSTRSSSSRYSARSYSTTSYHSESASSGRTYYRTVTEVLCQECYNAQAEADIKAKLFMLCAIIVGVIVLLIFGALSASHGSH